MLPQPLDLFLGLFVCVLIGFALGWLACRLWIRGAPRREANRINLDAWEFHQRYARNGTDSTR